VGYSESAKPLYFTAVLWNGVVGYRFGVRPKCGVRQRYVLSLYLFSVYVDCLINELRQSGHGVYARCLCAAFSMLMILSCSLAAAVVYIKMVDV